METKNLYHNRKTLSVNGNVFQPMSKETYSNCYHAFDIINNLKEGEYAPYYDKFIFKNCGKFYGVYVDDLTNYSEI
jgi:hypothetical protein